MKESIEERVWESRSSPELSTVQPGISQVYPFTYRQSIWRPTQKYKNRTHKRHLNQNTQCDLLSYEQTWQVSEQSERSLI